MNSKFLTDYIRLPFKSSVHVTHSKQTSIETFRNISLNGAFLTLNENINIGSHIVLTFELPTVNHTYNVESVVRWKTDGGAGVQFVSIKPIEVWGLSRFIRDSQKESSSQTVSQQSS